jgi:uncharacterized membrane protein
MSIECPLLATAYKAPVFKRDLLIIAALSYILRFSLMGWHGLDFDESQTLAMATLPTLSEVLQAIFHDGNPPLFYLLIRGWTFLFGQYDPAVKSLSLLISGFVPVLAYVVFYTRLGPQIARN